MPGYWVPVREVYQLYAWVEADSKSEARRAAHEPSNWTDRTDGDFLRVEVVKEPIIEEA